MRCGICGKFMKDKWACHPECRVNFQLDILKKKQLGECWQKQQIKLDEVDCLEFTIGAINVYRTN